MSEISDLESRISAAMDRIGRGLEGLKAASDDVTEDQSGADAALADAQGSLEREKAHAAELQARIEELEAALEAAKADAQSARDAASEAAEEAAETRAQESGETDEAEEALDLEENRDILNQLASRLRRMRRTSRMLRASNLEMRDAMKAQLPDATLVNQSLEAELEDLKAMRAAELAEMKAVNAALRPMLAQPEKDQAAEGDA